MSPTACVILSAGAIGHVVLWVAVINRSHSYGIKRIWVDVITVAGFILLAALPPVIAAILAGYIPAEVGPLASIASQVVWTYLTLCTAVLFIAVFQRWHWSRHPERHSSLLSHHTRIVEPSEPLDSLLAPGVPTWLGTLPGNEVLTVHVEEKTVAIPRLTRSDAPLRIAHITDLHISGRILRRYFERVVEETNALNPDIVALTGDIVESDRYIDWLPETLGRLRAGSGVYYVLGNHDRHVKDINRLKSVLADSGLVHVGAECLQLSIRGLPIIIGGNELPWFKPASSFDGVPPHDASGLPLRILLAHSPDEFEWAQARDVDLMLAGHLHGGQVRLPLFGAIFAPSRYGVRYTIGCFTSGNTVLHVGRGTGSLTPLRYNCPPEISLLSLAPKHS